MTAACGCTPRLRIARATRRLARMVEFYHRDLGLPVVDRFEAHAGYAGFILGMPGGVELEITQHARGRIRAKPDRDDLLVIYLPRAKIEVLRRRMQRQGHACVRPMNPWWLDKGVTFEDPDGWRLVLCHPPVH